MDNERELERERKTREREATKERLVYGGERRERGNKYK